LKFPDEAKLSIEVKDLIRRLLCNVEQRLGTKGVHEIKAHPWFRGVEWERLYESNAPYIPQVKHELDTQNFEKFDEVPSTCQTSSKSSPWRKMISSKDANFLGYTFKNLEIVDEHHIPGMAELKRKSKTANKPSLKTLFETPYPPSENQALKDLLDSPIYSEGSRGSSGSPFSRPNQSQARR
jgi:hypothetical protein